MDEPLNLVLFSGTDDKLQAAAVLTAGAAALGSPSTSSSSTGRSTHSDAIASTRSRARAGGRRRGPAHVDDFAAAGQISWRRFSARPRTSARSTSRRARSRWTSSASTRPISTRSSTAWRA